MGGFGSVVEAELAVSCQSVRMGNKDVCERLTYPLQLSHLNGKKSSWRQKGIWQCAPMASTSLVAIVL